MEATKGNISINTENLLPIIKKWLYSDKDIFIRELISNGCDAVSKLKRLVSMGEANVAEDENYKILVTVNEKESKMTFTDNGIGMTEEELENNLGTIAKSGSSDFKENNEHKENIDIIGKFGVGFYSAFMVANKVEVISKKYGTDKANKWTSSGIDGYEIEPTTKENYGTDIILYLKDDTEDEKYSK